MEKGEQLIFSNPLGSVTTRRLTLNHPQGEENIPIDRITSVSFQVYRFWIPGLTGAIFGLLLIFLTISGLGTIGGVEILLLMIMVVLLVIIAIWGLLPKYKIVISTGGNNRKPLKVKRSRFYEGEQLAEAINEAVFGK